MKNENLSRLAYLAQAVVGDPARFDEFVTLIRASLTDPREQDDAPELEAALEAIDRAWERFPHDPPSTKEIVEVAGHLEQSQSEPERLAGIALSWAAENQLWRRQIQNDDFDTQDNLVLEELSQRVANARGL
jgi:hypothetical protein